MVVDAWLQRAAESAPTVTAVQTPQESCSYARLLARARAGAAELAARGARPGERVAIALPAGLDFACVLHASLLLGAVAVPVDLRLSESERRAIATGAAVLVDEPLRADPQRGAIPPGAVHDLAATAAVIHTSGTTSSPKPVQLTYGNFLWSALGSAVALGLHRPATDRQLTESTAALAPHAAATVADGRERWLCALPLSHVGGLSILMRSAIYAATAVVHERFETDRALHALDSGSITLVSLVATTLARLLDAGLRRPPALRCALTGGGPVAPALLERARAADVPVSLTYGLTEACSQVTATPLAALESMRPAVAGAELGLALPTAGPPLFCTSVRIATGPTADATGPAAGEIAVAGPTVAVGSAGPDGWLRTGDLGSLDAQGRLRVTGRVADTIISGGENVAPTEVEAALEEHPHVLEAAVIGRPDERWGEAVTAFVVAHPDAAVDGEALRAHCAARLAPYKIPKQIALVAGPLPRTRSGKLLRRELT
jgi:o-succinylbenzoate---CoA ligase